VSLNPHGHYRKNSPQDQIDESVDVPPALIGLILLLAVILATIFIVAAVTIQTP
jgi:hypothetical protein